MTDTLLVLILLLQVLTLWLSLRKPEPQQSSSLQENTFPEPIKNYGVSPDPPFTEDPDLKISANTISLEPVLAQSSPSLEPVKLHPIFSEDHEVLEFRDGNWCHHSWRHRNHPDLQIYGNHKRFNVKRPDGSLWREDE